MDLYEIKPKLQRAKDFLVDPQQHEIRYACLELRLCLETIAYRNLRQYGDEIPGSIVGKWQPDQILKLLASFDPASDQDGILEYGLQSSPEELPKEWSKVADIRAIPWRVFRSHYQKLGSFLHESMTEKAKDLDPSKLEKIIKDIEHVMSTKIILALKRTINAVCDCGEKLFIGAGEFENDELVKCRNHNCGRYWVKKTLEDGEQVLKPAATFFFRCSCDGIMSVLPEKIWERFSCNNCRSTYRINLGYSSVTKI
ncbi:hypothetical protein [Pseudomonas sp. Irchel 3E13]|uniref:hypothetical protein n=1 Tax=Pseudomonas sp. Irchel 3E13 TaxID=2008975 RepID=UPI000BA40E3B|nr:hypothetical protein [Pseudomonas sp. Irchel 3E13]